MFDINTPHLSGDIVMAAEELVKASEKFFSGLTKPTEQLVRATEYLFRASANFMILSIALGAMWTTVSLTRVIFEARQKPYTSIERPKNGD